MVCTWQGSTNHSERVGNHGLGVVVFSLLIGVCDHVVQQFHKALLRSNLHIFGRLLTVFMYFAKHPACEAMQHALCFRNVRLFFRLLGNIPTHCMYRHDGSFDCHYLFLKFNVSWNHKLHLGLYNRLITMQAASQHVL